MTIFTEFTSVQNLSDQAAAQPIATMSKVSVAELDKHAKPDDCWIVVNGKVYDLTTFAPEHPGGADSEFFNIETKLLSHLTSYQK